MLGWVERKLQKKANLKQRSGGQLARVEKSGVARRVSRWKGLMRSGWREGVTLQWLSSAAVSRLKGPTV